MASNSILKLQVDDKQYEASLKNAQQGLKALQDALRNSGKSFADVDKQTEEYVRALGKMGTTAKTARGGIGEMSSAFVELSRIEKQLTDQERQSPVGKALTESLAQLKQRTIDAKSELQGLENQIKNVGEVKLPDTDGFLSGDKLSGMLQVMGGNLMTKGVTIAAGAVTSIANEIGDAVKQGIELAKQGEGIRIAFERLGRGDILDGLREATHGTVTDIELMKAAVKFNDFKLPVEELGTMLAFAQQKAKDTGQSVDYMVDSIVTGLGRKSLMILDNLGLSATEVKERMKETGDMTKAVGAIIREQMAKAGDYVETAADRAAQANVSLQNKMEELGRKFAPVEEASNQLWTSMKIGILDIVGGPLAELLNGLTEAGRLKNMLGEVNGEGTNTKVGGQLGKLRVSKAAGSDYMTRTLYSGTIEEYNRQITKADELLRQFEKNHSSVNVVLQDATKQFGRKFSSISELESMKGALAVMRDEYKKGAQEILNSSKAAAAAVGTIDGGGGRSGGGGHSGDGRSTSPQTELQQNQAKINELTQEYVRLGDESTESSKKRQEEIREEIRLLQERNGLLELRAEQAHGRLLPIKIDTENIRSGNGFGVLDKMVKKNDWAINVPLQLDEKTMKIVQGQISKGLAKDGRNAEKAWNAAAQSVQNVGSAFAAIEDPGVKAMGAVMQAIANVALGFAQASAAPNTAGTGWGWLAWLAAGTAAMATTISTIHSLTGYAEGGIVKGNSYSGDNVPALIGGGGGELVGLNAGEVVLTKAMQGNLASHLQGSDGGGMSVSHVSGEQIYVALSRYLKRTGQGEIVTWR